MPNYRPVYCPSDKSQPEENISEQPAQLQLGSRGGETMPGPGSP
jgi:hypothetical protein